MKTTTYALHFSLLLSIILFIIGCTSFENEPKPISSSEATVDIDIGKVIRSGEFEQRVESEQIPQNNCDGKSSFAFSVSRERTLEQSVDLTLQGEGGGELEIAGKPMEVGVAGKIMGAIGAAYGQSGGKAIADRGGMEFTIDAGDFPTYTIVWREKWEKGYITIEYDGETVQVPYLYQTAARPELVGVEYKGCETGQVIQSEGQEKIEEEISGDLSTNTPIVVVVSEPPTEIPSIGGCSVTALPHHKPIVGQPWTLPSDGWIIVNFWSNEPGIDQTEHKLLLGPSDPHSFFGGGSAWQWPDGCESIARGDLRTNPNPEISLSELQSQNLIAVNSIESEVIPEETPSNQSTGSSPSSSGGCSVTALPHHKPIVGQPWTLPSDGWIIVNFWSNEPGIDQTEHKLLLGPSDPRSFLGGGSAWQWPDGCESIARGDLRTNPNPEISLSELQSQNLVR